MIITIANLKGGVAKTTTAIYLSNIISGPVLAIDLDPQANLSSFYNIPFDVLQKYNIMTALESKRNLNKCIYKVNDKLSLIPATIRLSDFESNFASEYGKELLLKDLLGSALPYPTIILDTPPSLGIITRNALFATDKLIIPIDPHIWAIEAAFKLISNIEAIKNSTLKKELSLSDIYILPIKNKQIFASHEKDFMLAVKQNFSKYKILPAISNYDKLKKFQSDGKLLSGKIITEYKNILRGINAKA
jgi:chromosome partitioning protein